MFQNSPIVQQAMVNKCMAPRSRNNFATNSKPLAVQQFVYEDMVFHQTCLPFIVLWQFFSMSHFCSDSILGEIASLYDELCELEIKQGKSNPGVKNVYSAVTERIRDCATRFGNQQATCRTHFKKQPGKAKSRKAKPVKPGDGKEEDDA